MPSSSVKTPVAPDVVRIPSWNQDWLIHGFSTRIGGKTTVYRPQDPNASDLNLGFTASDDRAVVAANRGLFQAAAAEGKQFLGLVTLQQIHSATIWRVGEEAIRANGEPAELKGDGLMTNEPGVLLGIQTADCMPVLVVDTRKRAVAAFHAGWRGTEAQIVEKGIGRMRAEFGSQPEDLIAAVGPGIGSCCYSVGDEVRDKFGAQFPYAAELFRENSDAMHLDLPEANRRQLLAAGLKPEAIVLSGHCTGCHTDRFFSHRIEQGFTGRMMSVIGVAQEADGR